MAHGPKILFLDIETKAILAHVWALFDQNVALNQIEKDWSILSWAAKWRGSSRIEYCDNRGAKDLDDDKALLKGIWKLIDEAHIIVGHNLDRFDLKKLNARFIKHGLKPPASYRTIDTLKIAKRHFAFTSNKLEFLAKHLGCKQQKSAHKKFQGFELWSECLKGNQSAWREMEKYNKQDVFVLEEVYERLLPWTKGIDHNVYREEGDEIICSCGSTEFYRNGFRYIASGKYQRYNCTNCGTESRGQENLLSKIKRKSLRK